MGKILNGKIVATKIKEDLKQIIKDKNYKFALTIFQLGNNNASNIYIRNKQKACEEVGIKSEVVKADSLEELAERIDMTNIFNFGNDECYMIQLPLENCDNEQRYLDMLNPRVDADCLTPRNLGKLFTDSNIIAPCTAQGIIDLLDYYNIDIAGKNVVVVGRSNIVGKPIAHLMLKRDATVTICHSKTKNLKKYTKKADILIVAIGKPKFIKSNMVKRNSVVIDVGINRDVNGKLCGDVDFDKVKNKVAGITPVPNGVGAMTVVELLKNTIILLENKHGKVLGKGK